MTHKPTCPECGSFGGKASQRSPSKADKSPWKGVLKVYTCGKCQSVVPAHIWENWNGLPAKALRNEWSTKFRPIENSESASLSKAQDYLQSNQLKELKTHCEDALEQFPESAELWKLLGVACGSLGKASSARKAFLQALTLDGRDAITLANYVTSCFDAGDKASAINGIEAFFEDLDQDGKSIILDSLMEAVKSGLITKRDLPDGFWPALEGPDEVTIHGITLNYILVDQISDGHGYSIMVKRPETVVAYLPGYKFDKSKPIAVEILRPDSKRWDEIGLDAESEISQIKALLESMIDETGKMRVHPNKALSQRYKMVGGF